MQGPERSIISCGFDPRYLSISSLQTVSHRPTQSVNARKFFTEFSNRSIYEAFEIQLMVASDTA